MIDRQRLILLLLELRVRAHRRRARAQRQLIQIVAGCMFALTFIAIVAMWLSVLRILGFRLDL